MGTTVPSCVVATGVPKKDLDEHSLLSLLFRDRRGGSPR